MFKSDQIKLSFFYFAAIGFILLNLWFVVNKNMLFLAALPLVFLLLLAVVYSFDKVIYLIVFFAPLSIPLRKLIPGFGFDMYIPTEPLIFGQ
ncbi:MAG: hypothetical protein ACK5M7_07705 [Draconibacterium sp.]